MKYFYSLIIILLFSCQSEQKVVSNPSYKYQDKSEVSILSQSIKEDILSLEVQYMGCKKDSIVLIGNGMVKKSNPPIARLDVIHKNGTTTCDKSITKKVHFDLTKLKYNDTEDKNSLNLYLNNSEIPIEYVY